MDTTYLRTFLHHSGQAVARSGIYAEVAGIFEDKLIPKDGFPLNTHGNDDLDQSS